MNANPTTALYELQRAEAALAHAERHIERARLALGEPTRGAVLLTQQDVQHALRRIQTFANLVRPQVKEPAA